MIDVINLQRKVKLDTAVYRKFVKDLSASVEEASGKTFSVAFLSDQRMNELNKIFRGKDATTDVLSFPSSEDNLVLTSPEGENSVQAASGLGDKSFPAPFLGDIAISAEQAQRQAKENKLTLENEVKQLILHGFLHLCGYDHETDNGEMNRLELELREKLEI